jgi:hypothetical protein
MGIDQRTTNGIIVRKVFETLLKFPEGLPIKDLLGQMDERPSQLGHKSYETVMSSCIPPIKAGWLINRGYYLSVSEEGRVAFDRFKDPLELMEEAAKHSTRGWLSFHFPRSYYIAGKTKDQVISELRAVRRIGLKQLISRFVGKPPSWQKVLPVQSLRHIAVLDSNIRTWQELVDYLRENGWGYHEGGHAVYLPPCSFKFVFAHLSQNYPATAGLKIVKEQGSVDEVNYVGTISKGDSLLHLSSVYGHKHLTLVANLLCCTGLGPRLFDLVELKCGDVVWTAYVIEDINGGTPSMAQCEEGIGQLRQLENDGLLRVVTPEGFNDDEFRCPECEKNALVTKTGAFKYIDFQNFLLGDYGAYLKKTAVEATEASHFGDKSIFRGGRYLYQTVPGVNLPAKRNIEDRIRVLQRLFETTGISIKDSLVLDVGCNIGMMMSEYLRMGALWTHGWDRAHVVPHTEKLLLALGCTRFSISGADIRESYDLTKDIPDFLAPALENCVVSYLAVRGHIGWLKALDTIPWSVLIYEGHEGETRQDFERYLGKFNQNGSIDVAAVDDYMDGDSDRRTIALLRRKAQPHQLANKPS